MPSTETFWTASPPPALPASAVKLNAVVIRGYNDDELTDLIEYRPGSRRRGAVHRIHGRGWRHRLVDGPGGEPAGDSRPAGAIATARVEPMAQTDSAPAERFALPDGTTFGVIASTTAPFCRTCDRGRLTADGTWLLCLYGETGLDLREALRLGVATRRCGPIAQTWSARTDRGAEVRAAAPDRGVLYQLESLRADPAGRCTPGAADGAPHRPHPAADSSQHRQHRPPLRRDRYPAPSHRAARLLDQRLPTSDAPAWTTGTGGSVGPSRTGLPSVTRSIAAAASTSRPRPRRAIWSAPYRLE